MKTAFLVLFLGVVGIAISAFAQRPDPYPGQYGRVGGWITVEPGTGQQPDRQQPPSVDGDVKRLTKELKLDDGQQRQVRSILEDEQEQLQQLRDNSSLSRELKKSKRVEIHQTAANEIRKVLFDDQQAKYAHLEQKQLKH